MSKCYFYIFSTKTISNNQFEIEHELMTYVSKIDTFHANLRKSKYEETRFVNRIDFKERNGKIFDLQFKYFLEKMLNNKMIHPVSDLNKNMNKFIEDQYNSLLEHNPELFV